MKKPDHNTKIITQRLLMQPVVKKFKFDICREFTMAVTKYMPFNPNGDIKVTEEFIDLANKELLDNKSIHLCIRDKTTHEFLGICGLHNINTTAMEIGLWLKSGVHGNGYGTEAVTALINFAEKNFDAEYLLYPVDKDNIASRRIPEKLGFYPASTYIKIKNDTEVLNIIEFRKKKPAQIYDP